MDKFHGNGEALYCPREGEGACWFRLSFRPAVAHLVKLRMFAEIITEPFLKFDNSRS